MTKVPVLLAMSVLTLPFIESAARAGDESETLETVVVTAQKRKEDMQNVPIAITALSQRALQFTGITDTSDLKVAVPGLNFTQDQFYAVPSIRGIGSGGGGAGIENSVATYIDGVYIANMPGALLKLNDVEQVAVLKGPQGTLFGRNATGGVIQVTTRSPEQQFTGDAELTGGNLGTYGGDAFVTGGLTKDLSASASLYFNDQSQGFGKNLFNGEDVYDGRSFAGRTKLLWTPGDETSVTLALDYSNTVSAAPGFSQAGNSLNSFGEAHAGGPWDVNLDFQPYSRTRDDGASLTVQHDFGLRARLTSISAYRSSEATAHLDTDDSPQDVVRTQGNQKDKQLSEEVRLQSLGDGKLKWVLGVYYFNAASGWHPVLLQPAGPTGPMVTLLANETTKSLAGFAQETYEVLPRTNVTAGVRYTVDRRELDNSEQLEFGSATSPLGTGWGEKKFDRVTWRGVLDHRFSRGVMAYFSYNTGFKGGFFNTTEIPAVVIKPEYLTAYEAGIKADLLDDRVRLNLSGFYYNYVNIQVFYVVGGIANLANGSGAYSHGVDADLAWKVAQGLTFTGGIGWLGGRYGSFLGTLDSIPKPAGGNLVSFNGDATGHMLQLAPNYTVNLGFTYRVPESLFPRNIGGISVAMYGYHNSGWFADPQNRLRQTAYNLVDATVVWTAPTAPWDIRLWGKNLANTFYDAGLTAEDVGDTYQPAPGRTYGLTFGVHF